MAKMRVHEIAKEFDIKSNEILAFLQEKGIEAKAANSSLEEDAVTLVRNHFGRKASNNESKEVVKEVTKEETTVKA